MAHGPEGIASLAGFIVIGFAGLNIILLVALFVEQQVVLRTWGKILFFLAAIALPTLVVTATTALNIKNSENVSFCLSCHEMGVYGNSLKENDNEMIPAIHYQNNWVKQEVACYQCHTDYTMFGTIKAKIRGVRHVYVHYMKGAPKKMKLYEPYNNRECLRCHENAKNFAKTSKHKQDPEMLVRLKTNKQSCMDKGCHDVTHEVSADDK